MSDSIRLAKHLAHLVACSRSEAEKYIEGGFVSVDGQVVEEPGFRVQAGQQVELKPGASLDTVKPVTILLNKPEGLHIGSSPEAVTALITPENQSAEDRSSQLFIKRHLKDLVLTDPLGMQSSGLLVFTQDFRIARKLIADADRVEHEYTVEVTGEINSAILDQLNQGINYQGKLVPVKASRQSENRLRIAAKGNHRKQIADMCEKAGLIVLSMKRIRIGRVPMANLQAGQWRYLLDYEKF